MFESESNSKFRTMEKIVPPLRTNGDQSPEGTCPCLRPKTRFFCTCCGYVGQGRIKYPCVKHTNVTFINDFSQCPICKVHAFMLHEY
ncbi:uncharacterized protein CG13380 isoform X2 [Diachasmimorpha longicaudata]